MKAAPRANVKQPIIYASIGEVVHLDASESTDTNGNLINQFEWSQVGTGSPVQLENTNSAIAKFMVPDDAINHVLTFEVNTIGAEFNSSRQVKVIINSDNQFPKVKLVDTDVEILEGGTIKLDASPSSDPEGGLLSFSWEQLDGPQATVKGTQTSSLTIDTPEVDIDSTLEFRVSVKDETGAVSKARARVKVLNNRAPVIALDSTDLTAKEGERLILDATATTDIEGHAISYHWHQLEGPSIALGDGNQAKIEFSIPYIDFNTTFVFQLTAKDALGEEATQIVQVYVADTQDTPDDSAPDNNPDDPTQEPQPSNPNNGTDTESGSSGGGSIGYFMLAMMLLTSIRKVKSDT